MSFAVYIDPSKRAAAGFECPDGTATMAYVKLTDLSSEDVYRFDPNLYPKAEYVIAEIHPIQLDVLNIPVDRLSVDLSKSSFSNLTKIRQTINAIPCDMMYTWDHRFSISYYQKMMQYWIQCGIAQISLYGLTDFSKWERMRDFLASNGFHFFDRYHAARQGMESPYQKHIASFGNLYSLGGFSRVTDDNGMTRVRDATQKEWHIMAPDEQATERMLFAMADRDGVPIGGLAQKSVQAAIDSGLVTLRGGRVIPTNKGLWDTMAVVSALQQD